MNRSPGSLQIIPVLDLMAGKAVHALRGNRANYQPLRGKYAPSPEPDTILAALEPLIPNRVAYVADLDSIQGKPGNIEILKGPIQRGWTLWVDVGIREKIPPFPFTGVVPILGTETIESPMALKGMLACRNDCLVSVDLRAGEPIFASGSQWPAETALRLVERLIHLGARKLILLDLAVVGSSEGPSHLQLAQATRQLFPQVDVYLGGGIRDIADLVACRKAGLTGVLVATALQSGALTPWLIS